MVDGDCGLVVADKTIIEVAKRTRDKYDIVPLYYDMKKAGPVQINGQSLCDGLHPAFYGANIGIYSNNISKIWNSSVFTSGTDGCKKEAINTVKLFCMENNSVIDYAKTLYMPTRPEWADDEMRNFSARKLPHFFVYAKDKDEKQVDSVEPDNRNNSFVNKLEEIIPNPRLMFKSIGLSKPDAKVMMSDKFASVPVKFLGNGKVDKDTTHPVISRFEELNSESFVSIDSLISDIDASNVTSMMRQRMFAGRVRGELWDIGADNGLTERDIVDILVGYLYGYGRNAGKALLWLTYGDIIYENISTTFKETEHAIECVDCGKWIMVSNYDTHTIRCTDCEAQHDRDRKRISRVGLTPDGVPAVTDIRKAVTMLRDGEVVAEFESVEECCEYIRDTLGLKTDTRGVRRSIELSIQKDRAYKGFKFVKH